MKGSLVVVAFFCAGCMIGAVNNFQYDMHSVSMLRTAVMIFRA